MQEALARIASEAYILTSAQMLINSMLANHEQPAVLSAGREIFQFLLAPQPTVYFLHAIYSRVYIFSLLLIE